MTINLTLGELRGPYRPLNDLARKRATRTSPELRQAQLLACAVKVFARLGIGRAVHADVAREARVSVPTVFGYFPTGDALKEAVVMEVDRFLILLVNTATRNAAFSEDRLKSILRAFAQAVESHPDLLKVWMDWSTVIAEPTWSKYEAFQDHILDVFATLIEQGKADGTLRADLNATIGAHLIMGAGHMIAQMIFRHRDQHLVDEFIENVVHNALFAEVHQPATSAGFE